MAKILHLTATARTIKSEREQMEELLAPQLPEFPYKTRLLIHETAQRMGCEPERAILRALEAWHLREAETCTKAAEGIQKTLKSL